MAKMQILFDGFEDLAYAIDEADADLQAAVDEALQETQEIVKASLMPAAAVYDRKGLKGYATGKMYKKIITDTSVEWSGTVATVNTGFTLEGSGWHSIFVMYGTPRMTKDPKIYDAIKGTKVRKEIAKAQEEIMQKHLDLAKR